MIVASIWRESFLAFFFNWPPLNPFPVHHRAKFPNFQVQKRKKNKNDEKMKKIINFRTIARILFPFLHSPFFHPGTYPTIRINPPLSPLNFQERRGPELFKAEAEIEVGGVQNFPVFFGWKKKKSFPLQWKSQVERNITVPKWCELSWVQYGVLWERMFKHYKYTCTSFPLHDSSRNLTPDLPHLCDFRVHCCEMTWSKRCLLAFDIFPSIFGKPEVLGHQQSTCWKDPAIQLILKRIFSWAHSFCNSKIVGRRV